MIPACIAAACRAWPGDPPTTTGGATNAAAAGAADGASPDVAVSPETPTGNALKLAGALTATAGGPVSLSAVCSTASARGTAGASRMSLEASAIVTTSATGAPASAPSPTASAVSATFGASSAPADANDSSLLSSSRSRLWFPCAPHEAIRTREGRVDIKNMAGQTYNPIFICASLKLHRRRALVAWHDEQGTAGEGSGAAQGSGRQPRE
jgi:hypothetical protein